jgi:hypothetical protein
MTGRKKGRKEEREKGGLEEADEWMNDSATGSATNQVIRIDSEDLVDEWNRVRRLIEHICYGAKDKIQSIFLCMCA